MIIVYGVLFCQSLQGMVNQFFVVGVGVGFFGGVIYGGGGVFIMVVE